MECSGRAIVPGGNVPAPGSSFYSNPIPTATYSHQCSGISFQHCTATSAATSPPLHHRQLSEIGSAIRCDRLLRAAAQLTSTTLSPAFMNCTTSTIFRFTGTLQRRSSTQRVSPSIAMMVSFFLTSLRNSTLCSNAAPQSIGATSCMIPGGPQILNALLWRG